jgi:hypothetical protein
VAGVAAGFAAGVGDAAGTGAAVGATAGAEAGFAAGVAAGAAVGVGFAAGAVAADGVAAAGAEASAAAVFFDLEDFFAPVELVVLVSLAAGAAAAVSAVPDFWLFLDFEVVELPLAAVVASAEVSAFFDFEDFFTVDASLVAELSAASDFFDLEDFFAVELSAAAVESAVSVFLLLVDFLAVGESAVASSEVVVFFFFDFAALVSLWSVGAGVCAAWAADAGRRARFASTSRNATSKAKCNRLRVRFIFGEFLSPAADQALCVAHAWSVPRAGGREIQTIAARFFLVELREMMCEGRLEVKRGLPPATGERGKHTLREGEAVKTGPVCDFGSGGELPDAGMVNQRMWLCLIAGELDPAGLYGFR